MEGDALEPFVEDALNELEFLLGDASTTWGAVRAEYGHPEPYKLDYVQIGNEDQNKNGCDSYPSRLLPQCPVFGTSGVLDIVSLNAAVNGSARVLDCDSKEQQRGTTEVAAL